MVRIYDAYRLGIITLDAYVTFKINGFSHVEMPPGASWQRLTGLLRDVTALAFDEN